MSTSTAARTPAAHPIRPVPECAAAHAAERPAEHGGSDADHARRAAAYRRRVEQLRRHYRCEARLCGLCANGLSLLLVAAGATVGLTALAGPLSGQLTAYLGVAVILLEGASRVLRPALRAGYARRAACALDREFRLYDARSKAYRCGGPAADEAFVTAVERILDHATADANRDDTDRPPAPGRRKPAVERQQDS